MTRVGTQSENQRGSTTLFVNSMMVNAAPAYMATTLRTLRRRNSCQNLKIGLDLLGIRMSWLIAI